MLIALYGADELGIQRHLGRLKEEVGSTPEEVQSNYTTLLGREVKSHDILAAAMVPPFLAPRRMVVVEGFVDRFKSTGRRAASLGDFESMLESVLSGLPPTTTLVFTGGPPERGQNGLLERLKKDGAEVVEYPELKGDALARYIREEAGLRGIRFRNGPGERVPDAAVSAKGAATDPVALLATLHGSNTLQLANELDKLALYTLGRDAGVDDVALVCAGERAFSEFQFVDSLADGNYAQARDAYTILLRNSSSQGLLALLAGSYRRLITVQETLENGGEDAVMKMGQGMNFQGLRRAALDRVRRHGNDGLRAAYRAIVETDRGIKRGELREQFAMDMLLARLATIAPRPARGSGRR